MARPTNLKELRFLISTLLPRPAPAWLMETLASQRSDPSSMFPSHTPRWRTTRRKYCRKAIASSPERRSGAVTISTRGVPVRLKSSRETSPAWIILPASSSRCTSRIATGRVGESGAVSEPPTPIGAPYWDIW